MDDKEEEVVEFAKKKKTDKYKKKYLQNMLSKKLHYITCKFIWFFILAQLNR